MIPGTNMCVDSLKMNIKNGNYFLSHFHSDHYGGIKKSWDRGTLYCTPTTSRLAQLKFKFPKKRICEISINSMKIIDGHLVTFLPANHCPGAIIILFELSDGRNILHTGDFRVCPSVISHPKLIPFLNIPSNSNQIGGNSSVTQNLSTSSEKKVLDAVYLDTTYCNLEYNFPPHNAVFEFVWKMIQKFEKCGNYLYLFGTYVIGKEKLFVDVSKRLGIKTFIPTGEKQEIMKCLNPADFFEPVFNSDQENNFPSPPVLNENSEASNFRFDDYFTRDIRSSRVHCTSLMSLFWKKFSQLIFGFKNSGYDGIIGFKPSCFPSPFPVKATRIKNSNFLVNLPYSEHSSFEELRVFIRSFRIREIIPTVYNPKNKEMECSQMIDKLLREEHPKSSFFLGNNTNNTKTNNSHVVKDRKQKSSSKIWDYRIPKYSSISEIASEWENGICWNSKLSKTHLVIPKNLTSYFSEKRFKNVKPITSYFSPSNRINVSEELITPLKSPIPNLSQVFQKQKRKSLNNKQNSSKNANLAVDMNNRENLFPEVVHPIVPKYLRVLPPPPLPPSENEIKMNFNLKKLGKNKNGKNRSKKVNKKNRNSKSRCSNSSKIKKVRRRKKKKTNKKKIDENQKQIHQFFRLKAKSVNKENGIIEVNSDLIGRKRNRNNEILFKKPVRKKRKL